MVGTEDFGFGTQIRKSPYFDATVRWGAKAFSVYNHMYIPRDFGDPEQNFWNLVNDAILCDVAVERQVEITGRDAAAFVQKLTPRDLSRMAVGQCKYVLITNADGGILNDPILLRLAENHFWISLADSDILLWAQGVAVHAGMDVEICEPDVSPLQIQGPKSGLVMQALFGDAILDLKYYWLRELELDGIPLVVSRTGWSSELGYELYLRDGTKGDALWERIMAAGLEFGLKPGHPSSIRRRRLDMRWMTSSPGRSHVCWRAARVRIMRRACRRAVVCRLPKAPKPCRPPWPGYARWPTRWTRWLRTSTSRSEACKRTGRSKPFWQTSPASTPSTSSTRCTRLCYSAPDRSNGGRTSPGMRRPAGVASNTQA